MNKRFHSLAKRHSTAGFNAEQKIRVPHLHAGQKRLRLIFIIIALFLLQTISAQETAKTDSVIISKHSPKKATLLSMALPGLGQAYNRKYWKIPIIYAGFGTLAYFIQTNNKQYQEFKQAYQWSISGDTIPINNPLIERYRFSTNLSADLLAGTNYYRRNLEVSVMLSAVLYILNVVDAAVDAHFFDFNISDDLSLHVQPYMNPSPMAIRQSGGLRLILSF